MKTFFSIRLLILTLVFLFTLSGGCHHKIRLTSGKNSAGQQQAVFAKFVAAKLTTKLREVFPDTLATLKLKLPQPLTLSSLEKEESRDKSKESKGKNGEKNEQAHKPKKSLSIVMQGKYHIGGVRLEEGEEMRKGDNSKALKLIFSYHLKSLAAVLSHQLKNHVAAASHKNAELAEALNLSLELLFAYYESRAKVPLDGELSLALPPLVKVASLGANSSIVFLSKLQVFYFHVRYEDPKQLVIQFGWNADAFEVFLADVLMGK